VIHGSEQRTTRIEVADVVALLVLGLMAWIVYRPDLAPPFDYVDFPEDLLAVKSQSGVVAQYEAVSDVYADHGRWKPVFLALLVLQWNWFGSWTPGWYLLRFLIMLAAALLSYAFFRRLLLTPSGAFAAGSFLVLSPAAAMGWLRLSTPEPIAILFLALACHAALPPRRRHSRWLLAFTLLGVMWTKEIATVAFVLPVLIVLCAGEDGLLRRPRLRRSEIAVLLPAFVTLVFGSIPTFWTWLTAPTGSFASRYGASGVSATNIVGGSLAAWLPFVPLHESSTLSLRIVILALLLLILVGWREGLRPNPLRSHRRSILAGAILIPVLGALAFSPWPYYVFIYALPFVIAGSLLTGQALSSLHAVPLLRSFARVCLTIVLTFAFAQTATEASRTRALHVAVAESVVKVARMRNLDSVFVDVANDQFDSRGNFGPRFKLYASMLGLKWPEVADVPCGSPLMRERAIHLRLNLMCADGAPPSIVERFVRFSWPLPWPQLDSVTIAFIGQ
jgi:hypothetical protein